MVHAVLRNIASMIRAVAVGSVIEGDKADKANGLLLR